MNACKRQVHSRLLWSCHNFVGYSYANSDIFVYTCFCVETTRSTFQLKMRQTFGFPIPSATEQCMLCQSVATRQGQPKDLFAWVAYLSPSNGLCPNVATHEISFCKTKKSHCVPLHVCVCIVSKCAAQPLGLQLKFANQFLDEPPTFGWVLSYS